MKLVVLIASVRENRIGDLVGRWAFDLSKKHGSFKEVELIDLREVNLPVFNEPNHPLMQNYKHESTKKWASIVDSADAFIFVTPEYDHFAPSSLINAVQYLHKEWNYKPVGIVSYGGISGGLRSAQSIKPLLTAVKLVPISEVVAFTVVSKNIKDGVLNVSESHESSANLMLDELERWTGALRSMRG